jgi:hypothetical protein
VKKQMLSNRKRKSQDSSSSSSFSKRKKLKVEKETTKFPNYETILLFLDSVIIHDLVCIVLDYCCDLLFERSIECLKISNCQVLPFSFHQYQKAEQEFYNVLLYNNRNSNMLTVFQNIMYHFEEISALDIPYFFKQSEMTLLSGLYELDLESLKSINHKSFCQDVTLLLQQNKATLRSLKLNQSDLVLDLTHQLSKALKDCKQLVCLYWNIAFTKSKNQENFYKEGIVSHSMIKHLNISCSEKNYSLFFAMQQLKSLFFIRDPIFLTSNETMRLLANHTCLESWNFSYFCNEADVSNVLKNNFVLENIKIQFPLSQEIQLSLSCNVKSLFLIINNCLSFQMILKLLPSTNIKELVLNFESNFNVGSIIKDDLLFQSAFQNIQNLTLKADEDFKLTWLDDHFVMNSIRYLNTCTNLELKGGCFSTRCLINHLPRSIVKLTLNSCSNIVENDDNVADLLKLNDTPPHPLQELDLTENKNDHIVSYICALLQKTFTSLKVLHFEYPNRIDFNFVKSVLQMIKNHPHLESTAILNYLKDGVFSTQDIETLQKMWNELHSHCDIYRCYYFQIDNIFQHITSSFFKEEDENKRKIEKKKKHTPHLNLL